MEVAHIQRKQSHYSERFYRNGYEDLLYASIGKRPTRHTLWMLNRILNNPTLPEREKYLELFISIKEKEVDDDVKEDACRYYDFQKQNKTI